MAPKFFERNGFRKPNGFSDEEIDRFVQFLKDNGMTLDGEQDAQAALRSQPNDDPRTLREDKIPERLKITNDTPLYTLWNKWISKDGEGEFDPFEFMVAPLSEAHEICMKNTKAKNLTDNSINENDLDENQLELLSFITDIQKHANKMYKRILKEEAFSSDDISRINISLEQEPLVNTEISENMKSYGGFSNSEEFKSEMAEFENLGSEYEEILNEYEETAETKQTEILKTDDEESDLTHLEIAPIGAEIILKVTENKVRAWLFVLPPRNGGRDITEEALNRALIDNNIIYGVDTFMIRRIKQKPYYFKIIEIAKGKDPLNGKDGSVEDLYSRNNDINIKTDALGNVNYKELNIIKSVHKGEAICKINLPEKATDGIGVDGEISKGKDGKYPEVPSGKNTKLTDDRTQLISLIDGEVIFSNNRFHVRRLLTIENNVDNSIGNIDFAGDILIKGGVREGFVVKAEGDIHIEGSVEAAKIIAGGDILMNRGMSGGNNGIIETQGNLRCKFLENCNVYAKGTIVTEQVMYSVVASDESVKVIDNKGSIIGGTIIAGRAIEAKVIGSKNNSNLKTEIILGSTPNMLKQEKSLLAKKDEVQKNIERLTQNIKYIEENIDKASSERMQLYDQLKFQLQLRKMQQSKITQMLHVTEEKIAKSNNVCKMSCINMYPTTIIKVGGSIYNAKQELRKLRIYRQNGRAVIDSIDLDEKIIF